MQFNLITRHYQLNQVVKYYGAVEIRDKLVYINK